MEFAEFLDEYNIRLNNRLFQLERDYGEIDPVDRLSMSVRDFLDGKIYADLAMHLKTENEISSLIMISDKTELLTFIKWLSKEHPEIDLISNIPDKILNNLITEFIKSHREYKIFAIIDENSLFEQLIEVKKGEYHKKLFKKMLERNVSEKKRNRSYIESVDPLNRYKTIPLHAIFLYISQHNYIEDYIFKNWGSLSSMSGDYCDIYFSIDQLDNELDAFDLTDQLNAKVDISKYPGILFWENDISNGYYLSFRDLSEKDLTNLLLTVFQKIRTSPVIGSITKGEEAFKLDLERDKVGNSYPISNITFNIETMMGDVVGQVNGNIIKNEKNHQILKAIFESLEWTDVNKTRIEELERNIKHDRKAIEDVQSLIQKFVETNATNKSITSKLRDFAFDVSTGASGSLIASAIYANLASVHI